MNWNSFYGIKDSTGRAGYVCITAFGALGCQYDDTWSFHGAIDWAESGGGLIRVPVGEYRVTEGLCGRISGIIK